MTKKKIAYKIQNHKGLFSTGGMNPNFSVIGKTWSSLSNLKLHLTQGINVLEYYSDCKVVEIEEIIRDVEENLLQKLHERSIVQWSVDSPPTAECQNIINALGLYVMEGICYSTELKEYIIQRMNDMVERYVPDYMIENFDLMHNKGIKGCSDTDLAAIMLTATPEQQQLYNL